MKTEISRRLVLRGLGHSAALGSLAAAMPHQLLAAQPAAKPAEPAIPQVVDVCLTMLYPAGEGLTFDNDGFRDRHLDVLKTAYAGAVERVELRVPPPPGEGQPPPPVMAAVSVWIHDLAKFAAGANANAKDVSASMATITKSAPIAQFDNVVTKVGSGRETVPTGSACISYWFEAKANATWGTKAFANNYVPKWFAAYGTSVRRIEVSQGVQSASGTAPLLLGSAILYVGDDREAFIAAAATDAAKQVDAEMREYSSVPPIQTLMQVYAAG